MTILVSTAYLDEGERCDQIFLMHNARMFWIRGSGGVSGWIFPALKRP